MRCSPASRRVTSSGATGTTPGFLNVVVERADAIVDFILDPTRARRPDRVRDVEHSRAANPWADLQAKREWRAAVPEPGRDRHRVRTALRVVEPGR